MRYYYDFVPYDGVYPAATSTTGVSIPLGHYPQSVSVPPSNTKALEERVEALAKQVELLSAVVKRLLEEKR